LWQKQAINHRQVETWERALVNAIYCEFPTGCLVTLSALTYHINIVIINIA